ncbi:MAG: hypothetical protein ACLGHZ_04760 [Actinomycetes bacterium]
MGVHSHTVVADIDPSAVWERWTNVEGWPIDHPGLDKAQLNGPLAKGALGWVRRPPSRRKRTFRIVEVDRRALRFVVEFKLVLATLRYERSLERPDAEATDNWALTHRVVITGAMAPVWDQVLGRRFMGELPTVMANIVAAASA